MIDLKSSNKPEAIYGQTSLANNGNHYGRVGVAQEAAVYGETSLRTE